MGTLVQVLHVVVLVAVLAYGYAGTGVTCSYIGRGS